MKFRKAEKADAAILYALELEYIECPWSENVIIQTLNDALSTIMILESENGDVIGYGGYKIILDEVEIFNIVVKKNFQQKGYGSLILDTIIKTTAEHIASKIFLEVAENNDAAKNLYIKKGFNIVATRKNYYKSGNAYLMCKICK